MFYSLQLQNEPFQWYEVYYIHTRKLTWLLEVALSAKTDYFHSITSFHLFLCTKALMKEFFLVWFNGQRKVVQFKALLGSHSGTKWDCSANHSKPLKLSVKYFPSQKNGCKNITTLQALLLRSCLQRLNAFFVITNYSCSVRFFLQSLFFQFLYDWLPQQCFSYDILYSLLFEIAIRTLDNNVFFPNWFVFFPALIFFFFPVYLKQLEEKDTLRQG